MFVENGREEEGTRGDGRKVTGRLAVYHEAMEVTVNPD